MTIDDMLYVLDQRNRPGRAALLAYREQPFQSGTISAGGADIIIDLPKPAQGFVRRWEHLLFNPLTNMVNADQIHFSRISFDQTTGVDLCYFTGSAWVANQPLPLIGTRYMNTTPITGIDPFIVGSEEILRIFVDYSAPVAQQCGVSGWYKDLPI